jgi:Ricin-type beta-trefoil lectin domain-like
MEINRFKKTLAILLAILFVASLTVTAVSAKIDSSKTYKIMSLNSGKVLNVEGASTNNNATVNQYEWNAKSNQQWYFKPLSGSNKGYYEIVNGNSGKCLTIYGGSKKVGAKLVQDAWKKGVGIQNQEWKLTPIDGAPNYVYTITCKNSKMVLEVKNSSLLNKASVVQNVSNGGDNQMWVLVDPNCSTCLKW